MHNSAYRRLESNLDRVDIQHSSSHGPKRWVERPRESRRIWSNDSAWPGIPVFFRPGNIEITLTGSHQSRRNLLSLMSGGLQIYEDGARQNSDRISSRRWCGGHLPAKERRLVGSLDRSVRVSSRADSRGDSPLLLRTQPIQGSVQGHKVVCRKSRWTDSLCLALLSRNLRS